MIATNNYIIVRNELNAEKTTSSGLVEERAETTVQNNGIIESIGNGVKNSEIKEGDVVWFNKIESTIGSEKKLLAIKEDAIFAIGTL